MIDLERDYAPSRLGTHCEKWDGLADKFGQADLMAMWVADMDFAAPLCVRQALAKMVDHGIFGYTRVPDSYYQAFIDWEKNRHAYPVKKEWLRYTAGVVAGIYWIVNVFTKTGDACMILTPCYYPFMNAVRENERRLVCCELEEHEGIYGVNIERFEQTILAHQVKLFILSSPHNPVGRVWTREELRAMMEICRKHQVLVISDEIHQDIIIGDKPQIPTAICGDYQDNLITLTAASKTFNLAGCQNSFAIIESEKIRARFDAYTGHNRTTNGSMFGYAAVEAAYRGGSEWLEAVLAKIRENDAYLRDTLLAAYPKVKISPLEGTYLAWIDLGAYIPHRDLELVVQKKARIAVDYGDWFSAGKPDTHIRLNLATTSKLVHQAVDALVREIGSYLAGTKAES